MAQVHITVAQLISDLKQFPQDAEVVVAGDEEGNHYGDVAFYSPEKGKKGKLVLTIFPAGYIDGEDIFDLEEMGSHG